MWFLIAVIIAFAFASRLGSVVTFAGLITAGVAVALQNVILSIRWTRPNPLRPR
jgi:hypothetical protein